MKWDASVLKAAPEDVIVEGLSELLRKAGFEEVRREYKKAGDASVIVVIGKRENIFTQTEVLAVAVSKGIADGGTLEKLLEDYSPSAVVIPFGSIEGNVSGVKVLTPEWLADTLTKYDIKPPGTLLERFIPGKVKESFLKKFVLDGPLLEGVSPEKLIEEAKKLLAYKYGISPNLVRPERLELTLEELYAITWFSGGTTKKALIKKDDVIPNADSRNLKGLVMRILLEDVGTLQASKVHFDRVENPERILIQKATKEGFQDIKIIERRKAYLPVKAYLKASIGGNQAEIQFDLKNGMLQARVSPLDENDLTKRVLAVARNETDEDPSLASKVRRGKVLVVRGKTRKYFFEAEINLYSGELGSFRKTLSEDAMLSIVLKNYPDGSVVGMEKHSESVIIDVLTSDGIVVLAIDPENGKIKKSTKLIHPLKILNDVLREYGLVIEPDGLSPKVEKVSSHRNVMAVFKGKGLTVRIEYDGKTGEIREKELRLTREAAVQIALNKYKDFKLILDEESNGAFYLTLEGDRHIVKLKMFPDGRLEEIDRFLKKETVEELVLSKVSEIDDNPVIESLSLHENWEVEFSGTKRFGRIVIHRTTGEVLTFEYQYSENFLTKLFREFIEREYNDEVEIEWILHDFEEGIASVKGYSTRGIYFAKLDTNTGKVLSHDFVPNGLTSKLKLAQVEGRYRP